MPTEALRLEVRPRTVLFAGHRYPFTSRQRYNSALDLPTVDLRRFRRNLSAFGDLLRKTAAPQSLTFLLDETRLRHFRTRFERAFVRQIRRGARGVFHGNLLKGVRELRGCGLGLTPSGDDFIAGILIGLHLHRELYVHDHQAIADAICRAAKGSNLFSNTALELARQGLFFGRAKDLLLKLVSGNATSLRQATQRLLAVGASSGADLGTGLFVSLREGGLRDACQAQFKLVGVPEARAKALVGKNLAQALGDHRHHSRHRQDQQQTRRPGNRRAEEQHHHA